MGIVLISKCLSHISRYLVVRLVVLCISFWYLRDRQLEGHSRRFATSLVWIEYHPKSTIEAQPLHLKRSSKQRCQTMRGAPDSDE